MFGGKGFFFKKGDTFFVPNLINSREKKIFEGRKKITAY